MAACTEQEARSRAELLVVDSYRVSIDLAPGDVAPGSALVSSEVLFRCHSPGSSTFADLAATALRAATLNGSPLDPESLQNDRLPLAGLAAENHLVVEAEYPMTHDGRGLSVFSVTDASRGQYMLANCYPTSAPSVFCCFDQPDLRSELSLSIKAQAGWDLVANGEIVDRPQDGEAGWWRFSPVAGMRPYELSFCGGPYAQVLSTELDGIQRTIPMTLRCRRALTGSPVLGEVMRILTRTLAFYESYLGVPYPHRKLDITFAPDLGPMAMQIPALMYVNESVLQRPIGDEFIPMVLAHELAHEWFGALVEGRWWDDLWLSETMATFLSHVAMERALGIDAAWPNFAMSEKERAYRQDSLPATDAVSSPVASADEALTRPAAITYSKGASIVRQLEALIGEESLREGLRAYLSRFAWSSASQVDLTSCWGQAAGRDLAAWGHQWFNEPGVSLLRPEVELDTSGSVRAFRLHQEGLPRTHRLTIGLFDRRGDMLVRRRQIALEVAGAVADVVDVDGEPAPEATLVNDDDWAFARVRFDGATLRSLIETGVAVDSRDAEAMCWNALWDMVTSAELHVGDFLAAVATRLRRGDAFPVAVAHLLSHAVEAADHYAQPGRRSEHRAKLADAALTAVRHSQPGSKTQRDLAVGFAASCETEADLEVAQDWLAGSSLPEGLSPDSELSWQLAFTLAAADRLGDEDIIWLAAGDPVAGELKAHTCRALRPHPAAKEAAWQAALQGRQPPRAAQSHARGVWVPGQEDLLAPFGMRFFAEALPVLAGQEPRSGQRLARLLYPGILADEATIAATTASIEAGGLPDSLLKVLVEQRALTEQVIASRGREVRSLLCT